MKENKLEKDARGIDEELIDFFFTRIQNNFHLMICMNKTGDNLRNYCRMYPGLVNNTTIIWYMPWPREALLEVAHKYLADLPIKENIKEEEILPPVKKEKPPVEEKVEGTANNSYF